MTLAQTQFPSIKIDLAQTDDPSAIVPVLKILGILTILSVAPAILLMTTSFTRILIVLSFVRQALGTQAMPPNQVLIGLSLFLTLFTMAPIWNQVTDKAITPYVNKTINEDTAITEIIKPVKKFMLVETRKDDLSMFYHIAKLPRPQNNDDVSMTMLMPAFLMSELKTAFQIGFLVYIPFLIIDMVVSSVLMAMGMLMLPPTVISLPFKLVLFVLVDGWSLIVNSLVKSFQILA